MCKTNFKEKVMKKLIAMIAVLAALAACHHHQKECHNETISGKVVGRTDNSITIQHEGGRRTTVKKTRDTKHMAYKPNTPGKSKAARGVTAAEEWVDIVYDARGKPEFYAREIIMYY